MSSKQKWEYRAGLIARNAGMTEEPPQGSVADRVLEVFTSLREQQIEAYINGPIPQHTSRYATAGASDLEWSEDGTPWHGDDRPVARFTFECVRSSVAESVLMTFRAYGFICDRIDLTVTVSTTTSD
jgi:hypothetical protein